MLALGDALAVAVSLRKGFRAEDFAELHPGGKLGKQLAKVRDLMHTGDDVPAVALSTPMTDVIYEMSSKKLGMTTVQENGHLRGVISDGDLRRLLEREGGAALTSTAGEAMNPNPGRSPPKNSPRGPWRFLEERKITSLVVVDADEQRRRRRPPARSLGRGADLGRQKFRSLSAELGQEQGHHLQIPFQNYGVGGIRRL